jgi:uncharacterized protein YuzE
MDASIKDSLQNIFKKNFSLFLKIEINGANFEIMPTQKDIPVVDSVTYIKEMDALEILIKSEKAKNKSVVINDNLTINLNEDNQIVGFHIFKFKDLVKDANSKKISDKLEVKEHNLESLNLKESIKENFIKRNLHSIREFIMGDGTQLIYG